MIKLQILVQISFSSLQSYIILFILQSKFLPQQLKSKMQIPNNCMLFVVLITNSFYFVLTKCVYKVLDDGTPEWVDNEPHLIQGLTQCLQYNGKMGCCDANNDAGQTKSYIEIDGVFGSQGDACDMCAINLKRFWCQYACSARQHQFMNASKELFPFPDPLHPGETLMVQHISVRVNAKAACDLYSSCKRVTFVNSVSAMSTPAGFLNFQGHNAVDDAYQYIDVIFSYNNNDSLWFDDSKIDTQPQRATLQPCNYTTSAPTVHGFNFSKNCSCNNCEDSCDANSGFKYTEPRIFESFNWGLVGGAWGTALAIAGLVTARRNYVEKREKQL